MQTRTKEKQTVIKAIGDLGGRVTAADVASKTGLPILKVTSELNQIASDTHGSLEVGTTGDIAYKFKGNVEAAYRAEGFRKKLEDIRNAIVNTALFLLRISFGIGLILSLIIIVVLFVIVIIYWSRAGGGDRDRGFGGFGGGYHFSFWDYMILREIFYWHGTRRRYDQRNYRIDAPTIRRPEKSNFLFNCYSFLFGDGNPNENHDDRQWAMIAQVIRNSNGVVTAEQLAPYTGADPEDEDGMLPVLVRFNGKPEVTADGDIVYAFPELQVSAQTPRMTDLPSYLSEWTWKFSNVPADQLMPVYILAGLNFLGSWFLLFQLMLDITAGPLYLFAPLIVFLVIYGTLFLLVPFVRNIYLGTLNNKINERNQTRMAYARALESPSDLLLRKLAYARKMKVETTVLKEEDAIFSSDKDSLEQEFDASP